MTPQASNVSRSGIALRLVAWLFCWIVGGAISGVSLSHLLADRHVWDARISLPVRTVGAEERATYRSAGGGEVTLFATSFTPSAPGNVPFGGSVAVTVFNERGEVAREFLIGPRGVAHVQTTNSAWTTLATFTTPRLWLKKWTLQGRVLQADPTFAAERLEVLLRPQRRELGMGGMVYYVTIFIGIGLLTVAWIVAITSRSVIGRVPLVITSATLVAVGLILLI